MPLDATDVTYTPLLPAISPILLTDEFPVCRPNLATPLQRCTGQDIATMVLGGAPPYFFIAGTGLVGSGGSNITYGQSLSLATTGVTPGSYTSPTLTVNAEGQVTAIVNGGGSQFTVLDMLSAVASPYAVHNGYLCNVHSLAGPQVANLPQLSVAAGGLYIEFMDMDNHLGVTNTTVNAAFGDAILDYGTSAAVKTLTLSNGVWRFVPTTTGWRVLSL